MTRKANKEPTRKVDDSDNLPKDLADAIDRLPILDMIHSANLAARELPRFQDPVEELTYQAKTVFWRLRVLAELGNESAIKTLRDLGVQVANTLQDIAQARRPDPDSRITKVANPRTPDVITLRGDFSKINHLLETRLGEFVDDYQPTGRQPLYPRIGSPRTFVIDVIESLHWRNDRARKLRAKMSQTNTDASKMALSYPPMLLRVLAEPEPSNECQSEADIARMSVEGAIHDAIRRRLERRLQQLAPKAAAKTCQKLAAASLLWPTCFSKISEEQKGYQSACQELGLGTALPFRLHRKCGKPRKLDPDSPTWFALSYCMDLYATRERLRSSPRKSASIPVSLKVAGIRRDAPNEEQSEVSSWLLDRAKRIHELQNAWELAASKLPDFPSREGAEKRAWHHAAMLRAEAECSGEWDSYTKWPLCVTRRATGKSRLRTCREAVSFYLDRGIDNLMHIEDHGGDSR